MAKLIAQSPAHGIPSSTIGTVTLSELEMTSITSIAPFAGKETALAKTLKAEHGLEWSAAGQTNEHAGARVIWAGLDLAFLTGVEASSKLAKDAALTDQSDAWARFELSGAEAADVLARLVPADLRKTQFKTGQTLRSSLGHMQMILVKTAPQSFLIMVFRSMAQTALHELTDAMTNVAKRASL